MDPAVTIAVISMAGSVAVGWLGWRRDRRKIEVDASTAAVASTVAQDESSVKLALQLRDEALEERAATRQEIASMRQEMEALRTDVRSLRDAYQRVRQTWEAWARDLHDRWEYHRAQPAPPELPNLPNTSGD